MINTARITKSEHDYSDYELTVLLKAHNTNATVEDLAKKLGRSISSIRKKSCNQGIKLRRAFLTKAKTIISKG